MDVKTKSLLGVSIILIVISLLMSYNKFIIRKDFVVYNQIPCDPERESCFIERADEGSNEEDYYYKAFYRKAANIPLCDPEKDPKCEAYICPKDEEGCAVELCDPETDECSTPSTTPQLPERQND